MKNETLTDKSWPRHKVNSIETRKRDLVIRIADWRKDKDEPAFDVEYYKAGVYDWNRSHTFSVTMLGEREAKKRAIEHAKNLIEANL